MDGAYSSLVLSHVVAEEMIALLRKGLLDHLLVLLSTLHTEAILVCFSALDLSSFILF